MRTIALIVAIALGIAAAVGVRAYLQTAQQEFESEQQFVDVAVTRQDIYAGEELAAGMVALRSIPAGSLTPDMITRSDIQRYIGREVTVDIGRDIHLRAEYFVSRQPQAASARLPARHRAVTVSVDSTSGVAGLVRPGNRVDIYCTGVGETGGRGAQETWRVLGDVTVLAVDSRMSDMDELRTGYGVDRRGYSNLTLAVTPQEAQLLIYLMNNARLTFALRPEGEVGEAEEADVPAVDGTNVRRLAEEANRQRRQMLEAAVQE